MDAEIRPGGRWARKWEDWKTTRLELREPSASAIAVVGTAARAAGSMGRLSNADVSLLALAYETKATLVTGDHTMLDLAARLKIATEALTQGIKSTVDWKPRCTGCGKWLEEESSECPICGSPVRLKRRT